MRRKRFLVRAIGVVGVVAATGCGQPYYGAALDATLEQVELIRESDTLTPQEMREALAEYDIDPVTINGLLLGVRLANQFGGDLSSAYDKVVNDQLSEMTPDEVQYYGDATDQTTLDDAEAQAIVDFFQDDGINSLTELEGFLDDPANQLPDGIDEASLRSVFIDTSTEVVRDKL
jgi:hypothetical protein